MAPFAARSCCEGRRAEPPPPSMLRQRVARRVVRTTVGAVTAPAAPPTTAPTGPATTAPVPAPTAAPPMRCSVVLPQAPRARPAAAIKASVEMRMMGSPRGKLRGNAAAATLFPGLSRALLRVRVRTHLRSAEKSVYSRHRISRTIVMGGEGLAPSRRLKVFDRRVRKGGSMELRR